jgi:FkbM family methyltransferase
VAEMLISPKKLSSVWRLNPQGVLHIGAHHAEEMSLYYELGWGHMHWVEANPILAKELAQTLDLTHNTIHQCAAWDIDKKLIVFNETTDSQSSSLFRLKQHSVHYPQILHKKTYKVEARRIDCLYSAPPPFTFVNIDVQGAELQAIKGMGDLVLEVDAIYSEVNKEELYEGCAVVHEIDEYLKSYNFKRVATRWIIGKGWGDALYLNCERNKYHGYTKFINTIDSLPFYLRQMFSIFLIKTRLMPLTKRIREKLWQR